MIVHLQASAENIKNDIGNLRQIVSIIHAEGHVLAVDWVEPAYARALKSIKPSSVNWRAIYKESVESTARADVIVTEATLRSFGTGYVLARAIELRKPTLILRRDDMQDDSIVAGIDERDITSKTYNQKTLERILVSFLKENDYKTKQVRFSFVIERRMRNFLRWKSTRTGETEGKIVRQLIEKDMEKEGF